MKNTPVNNDNNCFCCGTDNERGLKLKFRYPDKDRTETEFVIPGYFTGWENITHGGFISMLLDETMAHACKEMGLIGVTAELTIRYKNPLPVGTRVLVTGEIKETRSRIAITEGTVLDDTGKIYATGTARFIRTN